MRMVQLPEFLQSAAKLGMFGPDQAGGQLVPGSRLSGPMSWVIGMMVALTVIALAAGLALGNVAQGASADLANGVTVQIIQANPEARQSEAERAAARLRATPGVASVRVVPQAEVDRLIEPWLGGQTDGEDAIPVPALVDVLLTGSVDGETLGALRRSVREVAPSARVDAQSAWLQPVFAAIDALRWLAIIMVGLLASALAAAVILSVRTAMGLNRDTIEIVHLLGGTDVQIARLFQRSVAIKALTSGLVGFALGAGVVLLFASRFAELGAGLLSTASLGLGAWILLALVPVLGTGLAMLTARLTVLRALHRML